MDLVQKALFFATIKHKGQYRKGNQKVEYIKHPINVYINLKMYFEYDDNMLAAAYLHDTLEDTNTTYTELIYNFNDDVANLVVELTNDEEELKKVGKTEYLSKKMASMSSRALDIKLCDRLDNIIGCFYTNEKFMNKYTEETEKIIDYIIENRELTANQRKVISRILSTIEILKTKKLVLKKD